MPLVILSNFFARSFHPKDVLIGAISLAVTFTVFGVAQSRKPQLARIKQRYPLLVHVASLASAVLVLHALGSILVFLWGFIMPLAGMLPLFQLVWYTRGSNIDLRRLQNNGQNAMTRLGYASLQWWHTG